MLKSHIIKSLTFTTILLSSGALSATELNLSHQWSTNDVRHKVVKIIADEVSAANVDLNITIFPSKSLFKPKEQYTLMSRNLLDMSIFPLSYAAGQQPAFDLTLMPGLVKNHDHAVRLIESPFMDGIKDKMAQDDVMVLVDGYLAGGFVSKGECIEKPSDMEGLQARAAGKSFEQMLIGAGASITSMSSAEIYSAMQTDILDVANTSSSSFVSYRIYEQVKCYTPASKDVALWFLYQPVIMNKTKFEKLNSTQQEALLAASKKAEAYYSKEAKLQDSNSVEVFRKAGVKIGTMTPEDFDEWKNLARETSYKKFLESYPEGEELLDMALSVK
ncbi:TRAP dicarboxylate transporter- DctP subunit [Psychromonas ingrahamii 37]|uniref:TRAP dicarboxylate transporter-DctP subunit n=1 Tax=Psychromonas ingrahamii (strain DSM 17664 / CCUG 51855 / 37) TaxID=357804 RepID=A1T0U1_PSYIN|nr:TRAP transporter substrate-binding protein DctP [Psychromonas ingrahamii]ABM05356.1 TRAP dicarboxylate transporter- DctP subunit [Psychromonas ingrahamii 37]